MNTSRSAARPANHERAKDYILQIKIRNGPLKRAMRLAGFETAAALSRASGVDQSRIGEYLALRRPPLNRSGEWSEAVKKLGKALHALPEDLFPPQHYLRGLKASSAEAEVSLEEVAALLSPASANDPLLALERKQTAETIGAAMARLPARCQRALRLRFGLDDGHERTLDEVGADLGGISRGRAAQVVARSLRLFKRAALGCEGLAQGTVRHWSSDDWEVGEAP